MLFYVTALARDRETNEVVGESRIEMIDTDTNSLFTGIDTEQGVKEKYESFWNDLNPNSDEVVCVTDVIR